MSAAAWLKLQSPALLAISASACTAKEESAPFQALSDSEAADFAAISARLIPTTETPGAAEAGVIYFFDQAFSGEMQDQLDNARRGLSAFNQALKAAQPAAGAFATSGNSVQDAFLKTQEQTDFFALVRVMTIIGFFAMDSHGGNRGHIGWDLIGFQGHHGAWTYPFGYYDAQIDEGATHGG